MELNKMFTASLLLLTLLNAVLSVPVLQWESSSCAKTCNSDPLLIRYDVGKTYFYQLDSSTRISYGSQQGLQSVSIKGTVELSTHSPCEMSLQLRDIELVGIENSNELFDMKQQLESQPLQFGYDDGSIVGVCPSNQDQLWAINVKKSVLSALQMSAKSTQQKSIVTETDILGNCETVYEPISRRYATIVIQKTKQLNECGNRQQTQIGLFPRQYGLNEVIRTSAPIMNSSYICSQTIDKDLVTISRCQEQQLFWPTSIQINSQIELNFVKQITGLSAKRVQQFSSQRHQLLMSSSYSSSSNKNWDESEFISLLRSICSQIQNDVLLPETTQSFPELVEALKSVSIQSIDRIWNSVENNEVCDSNKLKDLFLDASALATSEASVRILVQQLQKSAISNTRASYLFSLMAFTSNPSERALKQLLPLVERRETPRQVIVGISGLIHNLKVRDGEQQQSQTIRQVIDSIVGRLESARQQSEQISLLRALENIGVQSHDRAKQQLISLALNSRQNEGVRVVAIQVLLEASDDQIRQQLFQLFRTESESNELRIQAYKTIVMSGTNQRQLEQIRDQVRRDQNQNVANYVRSHQKNLRQSSDPHKRDVLPTNAPQFNQPSNEWGQSRNLELSYLHESTQIGLSFESDLIYPKESQIPRSLTINTTVPLFGRELQVVEIQLRQQGLDSVIKQVLRENNGNFPKILNDLLELFTQENIIQSQDVVLQLNLKVDGKTIVFLDAKDINLEFNQLLQNLRQQLQQRLTIDRAFAFIPVNTRIQLPTSNGLPMSLRLNTTLVSGLKADLKLDTRQSSSSELEANILPSVAVQFEAAVEFQANNQKKSIEFVSQLSSSPQFNILAQTRDGRIINAKINLPNQKQSLIRFDAKVYERDESGQRRTVKGQQQQHYQKCTQNLNKVLGISFCSEMSYSKPFLPFGPFNAELTFHKTDKSMKSFEFSAEMPPNNAQEVQVYRVSLNTPNSEIDREISAEFQISNPQNGKKEVRFQLRSPWKRLSASAALRNEDKERAVQFEVHSDNQKLVSIDAGIESQTRGQKREYRPRVRIQLSPGSEPIALQGSVSLSKGRKNQLSINLEGNQKQLIKGSFIREGERKSNEFRVSSDLTLNLPGIELRVSGVADKAQKHMMSDFNVEYKLQKQRKESFKLSAKLQNLTQSQLTKMSAFGELTSTQFPQFNFHLAYNLLKKPFEHVENELTLAWRQQLKDKIHLLQVSKYSSLEENSNEQKLENTVVIEITPFDISYELRANGVMQRSGSVGPKYNIELIGKDRTGRKENDLKGSFEYRHISRSPLHLSMEANLKTLTREMSYKDELKEMSPNQYNGKTSVQWQKDKMAQLDYNYKIKSDSGHTVHHEIDAELKTPNSPHPIRHTGLLRMTRNDLHLKSKVNYNGKQLYNYESLVSRVGPSKLNFDVNGVQTNVNLSPYSVPQLAGLEVSSDGYHHKSNVELVPRTSFALKSDTKRNARNLFALESHISNTEPSRFVVNSDPFEGKVDYDTISDRKTGSIEIRSPTQKWSHVSQYNYDPSQRLVSLKSNTELNGQKLLNLDSQYAKRDRSFLNVELPETQLSFDANTYSRQKSGNLELKTRQISHKSSVQWNPNEIKLVSNTLKNRQQLADLDYNYNNGLHSFNLETPQYSGQLEGQLSGQPFGKLGLKAKRTQYEHVSRFTTEPQKLIIESRTEKRGNNLMNLNALLSRSNNVESNIKIITPRITTKLSATPYSSAKFEWNSPEIDHQTDYNQNNQNNEYVLDSKTQLNGRQQSFYNFLGKHSPQKETLVSVKIPSFDSQIHFENPSKVKFQFQGKQSQQYINPVNHLTEFEYNNPLRSYSLKSRTERAINDENILSFDGQYNHLNEYEPSHLNVNYGQEISSKLKINPFNRREKSLNFETKSPNYNHVTDIQLDSNANALKLKSRTDNNFGQNLAKIDSYLTPQYGQKSHISIVTQNSNGNVEYEPQQRAKVEFRLNNQDLTHNSELIRNQNQYKLQSLTSRNGQNLLDLNSLLNTDYDSVSHLNINSPQFNSKLIVNPQQKNVKFEVRTDSVNHLTNFKLNPSQRSVQLQSNTDYQNRLLAHLNTNLNADNDNQIDFEIPAFESKSNLNLLTKRASIDFRSKLRNGRHVLASIALNPDSKNGFHSDISWDADKDPNQRLILELSARREGSPSSSLWGSSNNQQLVLSAEANYAQNQFKALTKMNSQNFISGPHSFNIDYIPKENPKRDSVSLKGEHVIVNNEFQCKWNYFESNQLKYGVNFNANANQDGYGYSATLETNAPKNPELEYKVEFNQRHTSNQLFTELKASQGMSQQYKVSLDLKQDSRDQYKGVFSLDTPTIQGQSVNFLLERSEKKLSFNAINQNGKQLEVKSGLTENGAQFDMKSNLDQIPSIRANLNYVLYTEVELNVVQDAEKIVDFEVKLSGNSIQSGYGLNGRFESKYTPNVEMNAKARKDSSDVQLEAKLKYNQREIFATEVNAQKRSDSWTGEGVVSGHGAELARASLESSFGSNSLQYLLKANGKQFSPINVKFNTQSNGDEKKGSIKMCSNQNCMDFGVEYKLRKYSSYIPEKFNLRLQKLGTDVQVQYSIFERVSGYDKYENSVLQLSHDGKVQQKFRNQFMVTINSHTIGFDMLNSQRDNAFDSYLKIYFPSNRSIQLRTDYKRSSESRNEEKHELKMDFKPDSRDTQPLFTSYLVFNSNNNEISTQFELNSEKFRRNPKTISFQLQKNNRLNAKVSIDVTNNPNNALNIESRYTEGQNNNRTLQLSFATRDRRSIDFSTQMHYSPKSVGVLWQNMNRNGQKTQGFYFFQYLGNKRFEAIVRDSQNQYRINGNYNKNENSGEVATDLSILNEQSNIERNVRLSMDKQCAKFEAKKDGKQEKRTSFCINAENSKLFTISAESVENSEKLIDLNLELQDMRSSKVMRVHMNWNPKQLEQVLADFIENYDQNNYDFFQLFNNELTQELSHKTVLITKQLTEEFLIPFIELFTDEFQDLFQELAKNFQPIKLLIEKLQQFIPNFENLRENLIPLKNNISYQMKSLLRNARKQCKYSETCYKMVYALENYGSQALFELLLNKMQEIGLKTHRLVITTSGQLLRSLPSIPIPEFVKEYFEEYSQELRESFETIINSNQDLKSFVNNFRQISEELFQENVDSIDWSRVKQSFNEILDIILSRSSLSNSTRVLIWDLKRGEIQIEIKTPFIHSRRLRAVMNSLNETTIKQMNKEPKVKHIIDSLEQKMSSFKSMFY